MKHARFSETFARRFLTALLTFAALAAIGATPAVPAQQRVPVYFLQGEQLARVDRPGTTPSMRCGSWSPGRRGPRSDAAFARTCPQALGCSA